MIRGDEGGALLILGSKQLVDLRSVKEAEFQYRSRSV
jgi:hypothetical protein